MTITIQRERFQDVIEEVRPLAAADWKEMIPYKEAVSLDLDEASYVRAEEADLLRGWTVRRDGRLVGYIVYMITPGGLHARKSKRAQCLDWWLAPAERRGMLGITMIKTVESSLRDEGVVLMGTTVMSALDNAAGVLEYCGHEETARIFTKVLNGGGHA